MGGYSLPALQLPQQPDLLQKYGQLMQLQNLQQESQQRAQLAPLQLQQAQQAVQSGQQNLDARQALNAAYSGAVTKDENGNPTIDANKLAQGLANGPAAYQTPEVMKGITDFQKSRLDLQTTATDLQTKQADMIGAAASAVKAAGYDPTLAHSLLDTLPQSPQLNQIRAQIDNPQALKQIIDSAIQNSAKQREIGASEQTAAARTITANTDKAKLDASMNPQSSLYAPTTSAVALGTAPGAAQIQANEVQQAGKKAGAEAQARLLYQIAEDKQKQAISQGDPKDAAALLVSGDATLEELKARGATPAFIAQTLFEAGKQSGGKYSAQKASADYAVAKSPTNLAFFGSAKSLTDPGGTLDQLLEAAKDIPQGQIPVFNSIADATKMADGSGPLAHYAATALAVSDDAAKVQGGGTGSDTSRLQNLNLIPANASPEGRAGAVQGIRGGVNSQINSRIGNNSVMKRMYGAGAPAAVAPAPQTHAFSASTWKAANPGGDVNAAIAAAKAQGFQVTQ